MPSTLSLEELNNFIVSAKAATYVGDGKKTAPSREGSQDLEYREGSFYYLDSYFGGTDFIGQEVVYYKDEPVWAMNYYGKIIEPEKITAEETGRMIKESLSQMYEEKRFLGDFDYSAENGIYADRNQGDISSFTGKEWITKKKIKVYELVYHGGIIKA